MHGTDDPQVSFRPPTYQNARKHALKGDPANPDRPRCPRRAALRVSSEGSDTDCRFFFFPSKTYGVSKDKRSPFAAFALSDGSTKASTVL